jgi:hypothetical protein
MTDAPEEPRADAAAEPPAEAVDAETRAALLERRLRRSRFLIGGLGMLVAACVVGVAATVWYWLAYLLGPGDGAFTRGPYLLAVAPEEARLRWRVRGRRAVELTAVGPDGRELRADGERLTGLAPDTRYAWTARVDGLAAASGSLRTPPAELSRPMRFAVLADYGSGNDHEWAVGRVLAAHAPEFVVTAGDNSYLTAAGVLLDRNIFKPLGELMRHAPLYVGIGDHDQFPPGPGPISRAFDLPDGGRYAVRHGPLQVVVLGERSDAQGLALARQALAEEGPTLRFVVTHVPLQPGDGLLPLLRETGVAAVFSGHLHRYERRTVEGVATFTVGTGGQGPGDLEFTPESTDSDISLLDLGALLVDVATDGTLTYTFVDERGAVLDRVVST